VCADEFRKTIKLATADAQAVARFAARWVTFHATSGSP
jgi:hypothetical protein